VHDRVHQRRRAGGVRVRVVAGSGRARPARQLGQAFGVQELRERRAGHGGRRRQRHHRLPVLAHHQRPHVADGHAQLPIGEPRERRGAECARANDDDLPHHL
jgi:hypothetical protein